MQHCEDSSLVLTLNQDTETGKKVVCFAEYTGANNQKIRIVENQEGKYQLIFVEPECAMVTYRPKGVKTVPLRVTDPDATSVGQRWIIREITPGSNEYELICRYEKPLSYQALSQSQGSPEIWMDTNTGGHEYLLLERTTTDEYATQMLIKYEEEFTPTVLMETIIGYLGGWSIVIFLLMIVVFGGILYARKWIDDLSGLIGVVLLVYMLAYASIPAIMLFVVVLAVVCLKGLLKYKECKA